VWVRPAGRRAESPDPHEAEKGYTNNDQFRLQIVVVVRAGHKKDVYRYSKQISRRDTHMKYHHLGIPTTTPRPDEVYLEKFKTYCTDHESNPFGIQWMRYEPGCPLPEIVKTVPHVAFEVEDLYAALAGHGILIEPNSLLEGVLVAFVLVDGAPVEFLQFLNHAISK
jgi:hypothetical protein